MIFFIYTSLTALIVQFILPQLFPEVWWTHGLFVPDSGGFHQIAAQKAVEIAEKGWSAWELHPQGVYPAGIASIFYSLFKPMPYSMIPFNAFLHATAGCLLFFLFSLFMKNRIAAAVGATLFIINPSSLEWTAQIHRDGTYILGFFLILTALMLLIKGVMQRKWHNLFYTLILTLFGSIIFWASRPYWNQVSSVACILSFIFILSYWVFNFRKSSLSIFWLAAAALTGCVMVLIQLSFPNTAYTTKLAVQENTEKVAESVHSKKSPELIEIENIIILLGKNTNTPASTTAAAPAPATATASAPSRILKIQKDLAQRQIVLENLHSELMRFTHDRDLMTMKNIVKKRQASLEKNGWLFPVGLKKLLLLAQRDKELNKWQFMLQQKNESLFKWRRTPYLATFIETKLYSLWLARKGSVETGGNTVIDKYIVLNSVGAFIRYFPRALQIGLLSPFPSEWFRPGSTPATAIAKKVVGVIMVLFYIFLAFFIWGLWEYRKSLEFWIIIIHSVFGIIVFTYTYANVGTLMRMRYGFYMVIVGIGFAFAVQKFLQFREYKRLPSNNKHKLLLNQ